VSIREASIDDIPAIQAIAHEAWPVAYYPAILSAEQLAYMLDLLYNERVLREAMTAKNQHFFLLEMEGMGQGFASCTPHYTSSDVTHLNKLYLRPGMKGTGAGRILLDHAIAYAERTGDRFMELNVNRLNPAIGFYKHMGFRVARDEVIDIGNGYVMDDHVMVRELTP
jgi:GNAT superfamily N-acetyltransferase